MNHDIALNAIAYLMINDETRARFLAESGMDLGELRARLGDPDCLGSVLDFLLENEPILMAFCAQESIAPEHVWKARRNYPGVKIWDSI